MYILSVILLYNYYIYTVKKTVNGVDFQNISLFHMKYILQPVVVCFLSTNYELIIMLA